MSEPATSRELPPPAGGASPVRVEVAGPVWTVILDRPARRNAVDRAAAEQLAAAFRRFEADPAARVAVLWGAGGTFCSGADLVEFAAGRGNRVQPDGDAPMGPTRMTLSKPVVAAIAGHAVAGGLELALWCDLRVMESDAILGVFCRRWGVPLIDGGTVRLPRLIGRSRALDLILTGRAVAATEAQAMGLVNRIVDPGTSLAAARTLAAEIAEFPQECLRQDRAALLEGEGLTLSAALANEYAHGAASLAADALDGARRFADGAGRHGALDPSEDQPAGSRAGSRAGSGALPQEEPSEVAPEAPPVKSSAQPPAHPPAQPPRTS